MKVMKVTLDRKHYTLWTLIKPAPDLADQWVAIIPALGLVTQGNDLTHAVDMACEASHMYVCDELNYGRDPLGDKMQPISELLDQEEWTELFDILIRGTPMERPSDWTHASSTRNPVAVQIVVEVVQEKEVAATLTVAPKPSAWAQRTVAA